MTTGDIILHIFCNVDDKLPEIEKHATRTGSNKRKNFQFGSLHTSQYRHIEMENAAIAMYQAKNEGRNRVVLLSKAGDTYGTTRSAYDQR